MKPSMTWLLWMLVAYLVALLWQLPAQFVWQRVQPLLGPELRTQLVLEGVKGTLWDGSAEQCLWKGIPVGRLQWQLAAEPLLSGQLGYDLSLHPAEGSLQGRVAINMERTTTLSQLQGQVPASELGRHIPFLPLTLGGTWVIDTLTLTLSELGRPQSAIGTLHWQQAAVVAPAAVALGDLLIEVTTTEDGTIQATLASSGGAVAISGTGAIQPDGRYTIDSAIVPRSSADRVLRGTLALLGRPDRSGQIHIQRNGQF